MSNQVLERFHRALIEEIQTQRPEYLKGPFTVADILHASEIGFVVDDVPAAATGIQEAFDLRQYRQGADTFRAIGDEHGLLLVFKRGRNLSLGFGEPKEADVFPTEVGVRAADAGPYSVPDYPYEITARGV